MNTYQEYLETARQQVKSAKTVNELKICLNLYNLALLLGADSQKISSEINDLNKLFFSKISDKEIIPTDKEYIYIDYLEKARLFAHNNLGIDQIKQMQLTLYHYQIAVILGIEENSILNEMDKIKTYVNRLIDQEELKNETLKHKIIKRIPIGFGILLGFTFGIIILGGKLGAVVDLLVNWFSNLNGLIQFFGITIGCGIISILLVLPFLLFPIISKLEKERFKIW